MFTVKEQRVTMWFGFVNVLQGMWSSRSTVTGEGIEPATSHQELLTGKPEFLLARKTLQYQIS
jgi:hypothetical protein